jgi:hypothetical protein
VIFAIVTHGLAFARLTGLAFEMKAAHLVPFSSRPSRNPAKVFPGTSFHKGNAA